MTKLKKMAGRRAAQGPTPLTMLLIACGVVVFYIGAQATTGADAHVLHYGLAAVGGGIGWIVGTVIKRLQEA